MVQVVKAERGPLIHIHHIERVVHGNGIAIKVFGEMKIAAKELVYARELKLNTLQTLHLTPETGVHYPYVPQNWIYHKGELDNYASVDVFKISDGAVNEATGEYAPSDGSIWLNFIALGE